jgi:DNA end-binding protein Ku
MSARPLELIARKTKSKTTKKVSTHEEDDRPATGDNVIDLMAALKKSLERTSDGGGRKKRKKTTSSMKPSKKEKSASRTRKRA